MRGSAVFSVGVRSVSASQPANADCLRWRAAAEDGRAYVLLGRPTPRSAEHGRCACCDTSGLCGEAPAPRATRLPVGRGVGERVRLRTRFRWHALGRLLVARARLDRAARAAARCLLCSSRFAAAASRACCRRVRSRCRATRLERRTGPSLSVPAIAGAGTAGDGARRWRGGESNRRRTSASERLCANLDCTGAVARLAPAAVAVVGGGVADDAPALFTTAGGSPAGLHVDEPWG